MENNKISGSIKSNLCIEILWGTMNFPVMPKGMQVQESLSAGGTCQPHPQMVSMYMCTDGSTWGWWPLTAPLNPALVYPLGVPNCKQRDTMWVGWLPSKLGRQVKREPLVPARPLPPQKQRLQVQFLQTPEGWMGYSGSGSMAEFFGVGWGGVQGGMWYSSPQEPIQTLHLWSCYC